MRHAFPESLGLRVHRALSWLHRAEQEPEDHDARFLFLWISFNAAYANEINDRREFTERRQLVNFMNRLVDSGSEKLLYQMIWRRYSQSIRTLIDNRHVFQPFWDHVNGYISEAERQARFDRSRVAEQLHFQRSCRFIRSVVEPACQRRCSHAGSQPLLRDSDRHLLPGPCPSSFSRCLWRA
jgi:hypothetical protein